MTNGVADRASIINGIQVIKILFAFARKAKDMANLQCMRIVVKSMKKNNSQEG